MAKHRELLDQIAQASETAYERIIEEVRAQIARVVE